MVAGKSPDDGQAFGEAPHGLAARRRFFTGWHAIKSISISEIGKGL
jgi:hypothetical protein